MKAHAIFLTIFVLAPWTHSQDLGGSALRFDGQDDRVSIPFAPSLEVESAFTLEAWVFPTSSDEGGIAGMWEQGGLPGKFLLHLADGQVVGRIARNGVPFHDVVSAPIVAGRWTHVALRYDGTLLSLFLGGIEQDSTKASGSLSDSAIGMDLGAAFDSHLSGQLDEVRLWSIARTGREILLDVATVYTSGVPGLVGAWGFDDDPSGASVLDVSGFENHGVRDPGAGPMRLASSAPIRWSDLGLGSEGSRGTPVLRGVSRMRAGDQSYLELSNARPESSVALIVGFSQTNTPLLGGVLVPSTDAVIFGLPTNQAGQLLLEFAWPEALQLSPGYFQAWVLDPEAPLGFSASNGLQSNPGIAD
ncbi:MAG: LamG domain-containing protein [Planctomycetota bacterium]